MVSFLNKKKGLICRIFCCLINFSFCSLLFSSDYQIKDIYTHQKEGRDPFVELIKSSKESIFLSVYRIDDRIIGEELLKAKRRGVKVKIILEFNVFDHLNSQSQNNVFIKKMIDSGIEVFDKSALVAQNHCKYLVVDYRSALLTTGNLDVESFDGDKNYSVTRDFSLLIDDSEMISEMVKSFLYDTQNKEPIFKNKNLLWGPLNQREKLTAIINSAQKKIFIYQQDITDEKIFKALLKKQKEGIDVHLIMTPFPFQKNNDENYNFQKILQDAGANVRFLSNGIYVHAKVIIVDPDSENQKAYVGSCNFYKPSLDCNRELGVIMTGSKRINSLLQTFWKDFKNSLEKHPLEKKNL
tara:strand:+ start:6377 stop:7438 length:1062 start_codon:yes stop_codon:yes gene_type:complete